MNIRRCLDCKRWQRNMNDKSVGICERWESRIPFGRFRFQFELCDCGMYVFKEHRVPYREPHHRIPISEISN